MGMIQSVSGSLPAPIDYSAAAVAPVQTPPVSQTAPVSSSLTSSDASPATAAPSAPDPTKVVVEPGANKAVLVFKLLDRATGTVLSEIPNQTPQQAAENAAYKSGALVDQQI